MRQDRREFLKGTAWMLGAAAMAGCALDKLSVGGGSGTMYVWTPSGTTLNLRAEPNAWSTILGSYRVGTAVTVLKRGSVWTKVRVNGKTGYMGSQYLVSSK